MRVWGQALSPGLRGILFHCPGVCEGRGAVGTDGEGWGGIFSHRLCMKDRENGALSSVCDPMHLLFHELLCSAVPLIFCCVVFILNAS